MRKKMVESDIVEAVIGLGPNLFYNSSMEACILVCNKNKSKTRRNKIIFINAINELKCEANFSYLEEKHICKIHNTFSRYKEIPDFSKIVDLKDVIANNCSLNIPLYVKLERADRVNQNLSQDLNLSDAIKAWGQGSKNLKKNICQLIKNLESD